MDENIDLELTLTCGQTFCWHRMDGDLYGDGGSRFYTIQNGEPLIAEETDRGIEIDTRLTEGKVREILDLDTDLKDTFQKFPDHEALEKAREELWGLRIVSDEFFPCLISYLCSPQMRIPRIKKMHNDIARKYGGKIDHEGQKLLRFPTPEELSEASEEQLRELGVGYRSGYIVETTEMVVNGFDHEELEGKEYEEAKKELKKLHGVGGKVADCVLLFSKGFHEAYPLDTWAMKTLEEHFSDLHHEDYEKCSENLREHFGEKCGYAQEYLFHASRNGILEVE